MISGCLCFFQTIYCPKDFRRGQEKQRRRGKLRIWGKAVHLVIVFGQICLGKQYRPRPEGVVCLIWSALFASPSTSCSNFRIITAVVSGDWMFRIFKGLCMKVSRPKKYICVFQVSALKKLGMVGRHNILFDQNIFYRNCIFQYIFPHFQQIWQHFAHSSQ